MNYFWIHQDFIPEGYGFGQFSFTHLVLLVISVLLIVFIIKKYLDSDDEGRLRIRKTIAICLLVSEIAKTIVMIVTGARFTNNLPLEICSFAEYTIILDAFLKDKKVLSQMLLYLFLPAALMALIFPTTSILPVFNFYTIHQFVFHALIVAYALMRFISKEVNLDYLSVWKSIGIISMIALFVYIIDYLFNRNFMFLMDTYDNFMLNIIWDITGGGIMYDLGLVVFSIIVIHVFYLIFLCISKILQ